MESWTVVIFPVLLGTVAMALNQTIRRWALQIKKYPISPLQFLVHWYFFGTSFFAIVYVGLWGLTMPKVLPGFWRAVFCGTAANFFIQFFNVKAASIDTGEVSLTSPLQAMTPGLITGLAVILGEFPSKVGCAGIFLMTCGSYVLLWEKSPNHWYEYFGPLKRVLLLLKLGHLSPTERNRTIVVSLALGSACISTIGLLFDGLYTRRGINLQGLTLATMSLTAILGVAYAFWYFIKPDGKPEWREIFSLQLYRQKEFLLIMVVLGFLLVAMTYAIQPTFKHTYVAYTGTLKRFAILLVVLIGGLFFHEAEFKKRLWAAILIIAGVILIAQDDLPSRISAQIQGWGL